MPDPIDDIFGADGVLARHLPGYERRVSQVDLARAVWRTLLAGDEEGQGGEAAMLVAEAETGIGKTLAYLAPAALCGQKVVISTGTLNLQEQLLDKDIPFVRRHIRPDLKAICVKGRQNYACLRRCQQLVAAPQLSLLAGGPELEALREWLGRTETGDRAELAWLADGSPLWEQVASQATKCLGGDCPQQAECFVTRLRQRAASAQVLIVNHHLFFSDLAIRRFGHAEVLPRYQSVIFDEAHHLENVATGYFGANFSHYQLLDLVKDVEALAQERLEKGARKATVQIARALATQAAEFAGLFPVARGRQSLPEVIAGIPDWEGEVNRLEQAIAGLARQLDQPGLTAEPWEGLRRRSQELKESLAATAGGFDSRYVYWAERRDKTVSLAAAPIEIAPALKQYLYRQAASIVLTSATLTAGGNFDYLFSRLGLPREAQTLRLPTPFDYPRRTRLYIPAAGFPEPSDPAYPPAAQEQALALLTASRGRALVLFTSMAAMRQMRDFLAPRLAHPLLMQGDAPKARLLDIFSRDTASVLLAVASFWEGVNVPGESLSCLIIDKLPFEVPSDPVIMARLNRIREEGGNPFADFQVPRAILTLRQGLGRLMRSPRDQGLLAILDIRLFSKGYGQTFRRSLPPSPVIRDLDGVRRFFQEYVK